MVDFAPQGFRYPSTRYTGSKRRLLDWIWENAKDIQFDSVLDVFGGTGSVSLMFKRYGKKVHFNDLLKSNQIIGTAIIENSGIEVTEEDIERVLTRSSKQYPDFVEREFKGIFFLESENAWIDQTLTNIKTFDDPYRRAILMASLFQACLAKRPFNLFHRANLYLRTANVRRTFGNKTTWDRPFPELLKRYVLEYNRAVFSNDKKNKVVGGYGALSAPNGVHLVYLDPPYFPVDAGYGTNYLAFYHFLEGLADYKNWIRRIVSASPSKVRRIADPKEISHFTRKSEVMVSFAKLFSRYRRNIIVLSYQDNGIPSRDEIISMLREAGKKVEVFEKSYQYVLSTKPRKELLFIAK